MWIKLLTPQTIEIGGTARHYYPGDWVNVGRQYAMYLVHNHSAEIPGPKYAEEIFSDNCGLVVWGGGGWTGELPDGLPVVETDTPEIRFEKTILVHEITSLAIGWLASGIATLDIWEIAVPLMDYSILAQSVGDDEERQRTKGIIRDLRVPLYDIRCMYIRRTENTMRLIETWIDDPGDRALTFLRALYCIKPFILALPPTWMR
jgi:hypothetical protein